MASARTRNRRWILACRPEAAVAPGDLQLIEAPLPEIGEGQILVRNLYLSLDPTNRLWMSDREQYLPPVAVGDVMRGTTLARVEATRSSRYAVGDIVMPYSGAWEQYAAVPERAAKRIRPIEGVPLTAFLSVLGVTGLTAYFGLLDIGEPKAGETVVVSAAAGAVGSIVGQIARIKGCRVIGIAGGQAKCEWIRELGFDAAIDYKSEDVGAALDRHCPDGIDVAFENVGGPIMDAVYSRLRLHGRMAVCGLISGYNDAAPFAGPTDFGRVLMQRLRIEGFISIDYLPRANEAFEALGAWIAEGRVRWKDHVIPGIENAADALDRLFTGHHDGKLIVGLADD